MIRRSINVRKRSGHKFSVKYLHVLHMLKSWSLQSNRLPLPSGRRNDVQPRRPGDGRGRRRGDEPDKRPRREQPPPPPRREERKVGPRARSRRAHGEEKKPLVMRQWQKKMVTLKLSIRKVFLEDSLYEPGTALLHTSNIIALYWNKIT